MKEQPFFIYTLRKNIFKKSQKNSKKLLTNKKAADIIYKLSARQRENGSIAQLGEHLPYKQRVIGSSPIVSTSRKADSQTERRKRKLEAHLRK